MAWATLAHRLLAHAMARICHWLEKACGRLNGHWRGVGAIHSKSSSRLAPPAAQTDLPELEGYKYLHTVMKDQ